MSKVHIHMHVSDLAKSRAFYEKLFQAQPVKVQPGYVKFLPEFAPINLALTEGGVGRGGVDHLGVQVDSSDKVMALLSHAKRAELAVREEMAVSCCYANQDKFWVTDPDGVEWEVYHLNFDLETEGRPTADAAVCCATGAACST